MANAKTINTRLVLRNAELSAWEHSEVQLLKGEVALAQLSGDQAGQYKVRIGVGGKTWNELSDQGQLIIPAANVEGLAEAIAGLSTTFYETDDIAKLSNDYVNGDIAVEKKDIADGKQEYCAYRWSLVGDAYQWAALDGNYSAENVFFKNNFTLAGDYTQVGNIKLSQGTLSAEGKSVKSLFEDIFDKTIQPSLSDSPTNSISLNSGVYEVGTKITPAYSITYNQGKYYQSWNNTKVNDGTSDTAYSVTAPDSQTSTTKTGSFAEITVTDGINYHVSSTTSYSAGAVAKDNKGNDSNPEVKRAAGTTASANSGSITGFRYVYVGSVTSDAAVDEAMIKGLTKYKTSDIPAAGITKTLKASGGDIPLVSGAKKVIVACPTGSYAKNLDQVLLISGPSTPITSDYKAQTNIQVSGATAGENMIDYKVWVYQPASIDPGEVHAITIK